MIPVSGISYFVFVLTIIFTLFYSSSSTICQDRTLDVSPTETETKRSVSIHLHTCHFVIIGVLYRQ